MREELIKSARVTASLIGTRVQIVIPSVLAEGETFAAKISVTGPDALPLVLPDLSFSFDGSSGIQGLPLTYSLESGKSTGMIEGLTAVGSDVAVIKARFKHAGYDAVIYSNPAWVFKEPAYRVFFGDLHVHTAYSNCSAWRCLSPEWCYEYARDVSSLDFVAPADHLRGIASDPGRWPRLRKLAGEYDAPGGFVSFLAFESSHARGFGGDNNVYYIDNDAPYFWVDREEMRGTSPEVHLRELWAQLDKAGKQYFTVPHHTGRAGKYRAWNEDYHDPAREPLFEIYSSWGSSESRYSRFAISGGNNDAPSYFVDALKAGARFGLIASSDDHATLPGSVHNFRVEPFSVPSLAGFAHKGLAAIRAPELTRASLFAAMRSRNTYATTHARSLVDFRVGDASMGEAVPVDRSLRAGREIRVRFTLHATSNVRVILMRNGVEFDARSVNGPELAAKVNEVVFTDPEDIEKAALRGALYHPEPYVVYYARMESGNGAHQWTSPIWLDLE